MPLEYFLLLQFISLRYGPYLHRSVRRTCGKIPMQLVNPYCIPKGRRHNLLNVRTEKNTGYILFVRAELGYGLVSWEVGFLFVDLPDVAFALITER